MLWRDRIHADQAGCPGPGKHQARTFTALGAILLGAIHVLNYWGFPGAIRRDDGRQPRGRGRFPWGEGERRDWSAFSASGGARPLLKRDESTG